MRFCSERVTYSSLLRTCSVHRPYARKMKIARMTYWTTENFVCGIFSSRPSIPCHGLSLVQQCTGWKSLCCRPYLEYRILAGNDVRQSTELVTEGLEKYTVDGL